MYFCVGTSLSCRGDRSTVPAPRNGRKRIRGLFEEEAEPKLVWGDWKPRFTQTLVHT